MGSLVIFLGEASWTWSRLDGLDTGVDDFTLDAGEEPSSALAFPSASPELKFDFSLIASESNDTSFNLLAISARKLSLLLCRVAFRWSRIARLGVSPFTIQTW